MEDRVLRTEERKMTNSTILNEGLSGTCDAFNKNCQLGRKHTHQSVEVRTVAIKITATPEELPYLARYAARL